MSVRKKFGLALIAFAVLAVLSWLTLSDDPVQLRETVLGFDVHLRFRTATLAVLGLLTALSSLSFWYQISEEQRQAESRQD